MLSQALLLLGLRAESRETESEIKDYQNVGVKFLCKSCDSLIVMNFQRLVFTALDMRVTSHLLTYRV